MIIEFAEKDITKKMLIYLHILLTNENLEIKSMLGKDFYV